MRCFPHSVSFVFSRIQTAFTFVLGCYGTQHCPALLALVRWLVVFFVIANSVFVYTLDNEPDCLILMSFGLLDNEPAREFLEPAREFLEPA